MQPVSAPKTVPVPTKYIVLKNSNGAPVVSKVVRPSQSNDRTENVNKVPKEDAAGTPTIVTRKAYERHGTDDFLKRISSAAAQKPKVVIERNASLAAEAKEMSMSNNKKPSPPMQINIFSSLDEMAARPPKRKEQPKRVASRVEVSCTYQPPVRPPQTSTEKFVQGTNSTSSGAVVQKEQSLFDKLASKEDWLVDIIGSPTKSPIKPGGSTIDVSDNSSDEDSGANTVPSNQQKQSSATASNASLPVEKEVIVLDSSLDEEDRVASAQKHSKAFSIESGDDGSVHSDKKEECKSKSASSKADAKYEGGKELSFVEARSRRKRKPPTYFGYEDHELSYNLGLNPIFSQDEQMDAIKKKKAQNSAENNSTNLSSTLNSKHSSSRRTNSKGRQRRNKNEEDNDFEDDDEDEELRSNCSSRSSNHSSKSNNEMKLRERINEMFADTSDEDILQTVVNKAAKPKGESADDVKDVDEKGRTADKKQSIVDNCEIETTAFRLYYKEISQSVSSGSSLSPQQLTDNITHKWYSLSRSEKETYEKQARELTQINLPPPRPTPSDPTHTKLSSSSPSSGAGSGVGAQQIQSPNKEQQKAVEPKAERGLDNNHVNNAVPKRSKTSDGKVSSGGVLGKISRDLHLTDSTTESESESDWVKRNRKKLAKHAAALASSSGSEDDSSISHRKRKSRSERKKKRRRAHVSTSSSDDSSAEESTSSSSSSHQSSQKPSKAVSAKVPDKEPTVPKKEQHPEPTVPQICFNCPKVAIKSSLWCSDGRYCSISCCVLYSKKCFNDFIAEKKRKSEILREQSEIEALKHAKDFFCIDTAEEDAECAPNESSTQNETDHPPEPTSVFAVFQNDPVDKIE